MKYLYLIIRHIFPRKRWVIEHQTEITNGQNEFIGYMFICKDQFGNFKVTKTYAAKH